jgi:hypothetical protein
MKIRHILSDKWWIHPDSTEIDHNKWSSDQKAAYFETNYDLPPLIEGADASTVQAVLIGSLTKEQFNQQMALQVQGGQSHNPYWYEHVIRCGVRDWRGFYLDSGAGPVEIAPIYEDGPYGRWLSKKSYDDLLFFYQTEMISVAYQIFLMSSK